MDLFFYGTLMDADVRRLVLGPGAERMRLEPARLYGYRRVAKRRSTAPVLISRQGAWVQGFLARRLDSRQVARLRHFEGCNYRLASCAVRLSGGEQASAYVFLGAGDGALGQDSWRLAPWQRRHKHAFIRQMALWMAAYREAGYLARGSTGRVTRWAGRS